MRLCLGEFLLGNVPKLVEIGEVGVTALSLWARGVESTKKGNAMKKDSMPAGFVAGVETAWENVTASFERFCLTAGHRDTDRHDGTGCGGYPH